MTITVTIEFEAAPGARDALVAKMHEIIRGDLTEKQRRVLQAELRGMPQAEIARIEGVATGTVKSRISRAREFLKEALLSFQTRTREHTSPTNNTSIPRS